MKYQKIIIIFNPASSNAKRSLRRIKELIKAYPDKKISIINTVSDGNNASILEDNKSMLGKDTLLCIAAGDGTVSSIISALLTHGKLSKEQKQSVVVPLWGGNANDLAYMLNGFSPINRLKRMIAKASVVSIYPIKIIIKNGQKKEIFYATNYVSFGATGFAAEQLNSKDYRSRRVYKFILLRLIAELYIVLKAFVETPRFTIVEGGKKFAIYERIIVNGSRIGKIGKLPLKLTDRAFYVATATNKSPKTLFYALKIFRKRKPLGEIKHDARLQFSIAKSVWAQVDGEVLWVKKGSKVEIEIADISFNALSTRLSEKK